MAEHTKVYVIECMSPEHWYVGSTYRELHARIQEHEEGFGCVWTQRHGFKRMAIWADVPSAACSALEDELTEWLMHQYGVRNVRGGNYVNCRTDCYANDWWLPKSLCSGSGFTNVPGLHYRPVSKFPLELESLIDAFNIFRRLENANHLHTQAFPEPVLGRVAEQQEHVLPAQLVAGPLGAEQEAVGCVCANHGQEPVERHRHGFRKLQIDGAPGANRFV